MNAQPIQPSSQKHDHTAHAISILLEGIRKVTEGLKTIPEARKMTFNIELEQIYSFLDSFVFLYENMPETAVRNTLLNTIKTIVKKWTSLPTGMTSKLRDVSIHSTSLVPEFLHEALSSIGPDIRLSQNEMKAWITVDKDFTSLLNPNIIIEALHQNGITAGVLSDAVADLFASNRFNEEVLIAEGTLPQSGKNGTVRYCIEVDDLGNTPKLLENGSVSYKDIRLFAFASKGDRLAIGTAP